MAAAGAERSKPPRLPEFSVGGLKRGNQKSLRCMKADSGAVAVRSTSSWSSSSLFPDDWSPESFRKSLEPALSARIGGLKTPRPIESDDGDDDGIEAMRTRLVLDLKTSVDKVNVSLVRFGEAEDPPPPPVVAAAEEAECRGI